MSNLSLETLKDEIETVEMDGKKVHVIDARSFQKRLGNNKIFRHWIKEQLSDFTINRDYRKGVDGNVVSTTVPYQGTVVDTGIQRRIEYKISLKVAKHICLKSQTEIGFDYRNRLISLEEAYEKNGYLVNPRATVLQLNKCLDEIDKLDSRIFADRQRVKAIKYVAGYFLEHGYGMRAIKSMLSNIYQDCYAILFGKTAAQIVFDVIDKGLTEESIVTINQMRRNNKAVYKADYHSAINFLTPSQLAEFGEYYEVIIKTAVMRIKSKKLGCTPKVIRDTIRNTARVLVLQCSNLKPGDVLETKNRKGVNELCDKVYDSGFELTRESTQEFLNEVEKMATKKYVVKAPEFDFMK